MPDLGPMEILLILVVLIIVFGVGKLPEIGRGIGKTIREFNKARAGEDEDDKDKHKNVASSSQAETGSKS
jgi:sec-independent protein translocase protein TatA